MSSDNSCVNLASECPKLIRHNYNSPGMGVTERAVINPKADMSVLSDRSALRLETDGRGIDQSCASESKNQATVTRISKIYHPFLTHTTA
jgi:hypothetical protein